MSDRSRGEGWWQAADGKWYPPELLDAPRQQWPTTELTPVVPGLADTTVPRGTGAQIAIAVTSLLFAGVGVSGLLFASAIRDAGDGWADAITPLGGEEVWVSFSAASLLSLLVAAIAFIIWTFRTSQTLDRRGIEDRRWQSGWAIGAWFVPFVNFVLPRLLFSEMERGLAEPYLGSPIGNRWKTRRRFTVGDVWWFLWIAGNIVSFIGTYVVIADPLADSAARYSTLLSVSSIGSFIVALAGAVLVLEIRTIVEASAHKS